jgi:RNA polymerase-binding transcription factor DksA
MSAPLAQWPGLALTLTEEQHAELRAGMEQELGRALSRRGLEPRMQPRARQLLDALARMHAETYGICVACRSPIAYGRLLAVPETNVCVHCSWSRESSSKV